MTREQLMTDVSILARIARCCLPTISYRVAASQSKSKKPVVGDFKTGNTLIRYNLVTADDGIHFHHGLDWDDMRIGYVGDASFAEEEEYNEFTGELEPHRSQGGRIIILASPELVKGTVVFFHVLGYTSSVLRRVVRSTIQELTYNI